MKPLAPVQAGMLRARGMGLNVVQVELRFRPGLAPEEIHRAWLATVAATPTLRTGFVFREGNPVGWEERNGPVDWRVGANAAEDFGAWLVRDRQEDFEWKTGVPWRVNVWPQQGRWVWTVHHGLLDGRSISRILRHFLMGLQGVPSPRLEPAVWSPASPAVTEKGRPYFSQALDGVELAWPDFGGGPGGSVATQGGPALVEQLETAARSHGVTPATILIWAWGQVLMRAAGTGSVVLGQVRAGPPEPGRAGFTMNTLPVVVRRHRQGSANSGWDSIRAQMLALRGYESFAPEDWSSGMPGAADRPWSGVVMVEKGTLEEQLGPEAMAPLEMARLHEHPSDRLMACAWLRPDLRLELTVDGSIGTEGAAVMLEHWLHIVRNCAGDPLAESPQATRLPPALEGRLAGWEDGGPGLPGPSHLAQAWQEARRQYARETAVWTPGESLSYQEMGSRVDEVAESLSVAGVRSGQTVAVKAERRSLWPRALMAVVCMGAVYLPLGPRISAPRLRSMVRQGAPQVLLCCRDLEEDFGLPRVDLESGPRRIPQEPGSGPVPETDPVVHPVGQSMALLYTSGSTGLPKGVLLEHGGVLNEARWLIRTLGLQPGDRMLQFSSPGFDASLEEMLSCLLSGATLVPRPEEVSEDLALFHGFIQTAGVTVLDLPTAFWATWCAWMGETGQRVPAGVRTAIIGGERATARALADWRAAGGRTLWNSYGPTEASIVATAWEIGTAWHGPEDPAIGRPLPGYRVRVAGPDGDPMPPGAAGEIWIGGPSVGPGYHGQDELTAAAFTVRDGMRWYRTGDRARWDSGGLLRFLGRSDDQLKLRGHRIEAGEIVRLLESWPQVAAAHAGAWAGTGPPVIAAWVRWEGQPPEDWQGLLRGYLREHLPAAAIPVRWAAVDAFALTERGKLDRRALPEPQPLRHGPWEAPATLTEARIAARWESLLGTAGVGRQDSFFDLGGHSLAALRFFSWLQAEFGTRLPMTTLLSSPTLAALAKTVDEATALAPGAHPARTALVVPLRGGGGGPPLFCVHGGDGGVFFYQNLADQLPAWQKVSTIEAPALGAAGPVEVIPVEEAASAYLAAVRAVQPQGPYHLAGYSFGGVVAWEMAAQLRQAGETVAFTGLFDTENPACHWPRYRWRERLAVFWQAKSGRAWWQRTAQLAGRILSGTGRHLSRRFQLCAIRHGGPGAPYSRRRALQVREAHSAAMEAYQPSPLDVPVVLFRTRAVDDKYRIAPDYGWGGLTAGLDIVGTGGGHLTMFSKTHAPSLARAVAQRLPRPDPDADERGKLGVILERKLRVES